NALVLDLTYDRVLSHADLVAGGNRWERAWEESGILPLAPADLHRMHSGLFGSPAVAKKALVREKGGWGQIPKSTSLLWAVSPPPPMLWRYELAARRGTPTQILVDTTRHPDAHAAVEARL